MRRHYFAYAALVLMVMPAALQLASCTSTELGGVKNENQPPTVWLSSAPPEGTTEKYTIRLFWGGWDPDGEIDHYEYRITNNEGGTFVSADTAGAWDSVYGNDSTFTFSADVPADSNNTVATVAEFQRSHTFFIRSVDEEGLKSIEPAHRSFTARTLSPNVQITIPVKNGFNAALVPPISTVTWEAFDYVGDLLSKQEPESVQTVLVDAGRFNDDYLKALNYLRKDPVVLAEYGLTAAQSDAEWDNWIFYRGPGEEGKTWTSPPLDRGSYLFAIRAKDEAGAITPVLSEEENVRRLFVSARTTGPLFTVLSEFIGSITTVSCSTPVTIIDLPAGVPVGFCWRADASSYGGKVSGYRFGWDIFDLSNDDEWEVDFTPFSSTTACTPSARRFNFGTHTFTVEVIDNSGFCSRVQVKINYIQFDMNKNAVLVDDFFPDENPVNPTSWNVGGGGLPSDQQHDDFWLDMLSDLEGFDPDVDVVSIGRSGEVALTQIANYKSVIWNVYGARGLLASQLPLLAKFIEYRPKDPETIGGSAGKVRPNLVALFMAAGGHVFISGNHPVTNSIVGSPRYPFMFLYDQDGNQDRAPNIDNPLGDLSFGYKELCLETMDFTHSGNAVRRQGSLIQCPVRSFRTGENSPTINDGIRGVKAFDLNFVTAMLRPETAGPGKFYSPPLRSYDVEVYNPQYFFDECEWTAASRDCFEPIYGVISLDTGEPTYMQPCAFWTSAFADRVPENGVGARSVIFGFPPVFLNPSEMKPGIEYILYTEWQLPRVP